MKPAIRIENISKQYRLGVTGTGTLSHDLKRWWYLARGKEDPYLKIGDTNDRTTVGESNYVWALKDISFDVEPGEVLGIIGKNGAGKSTLLKILSRVTAPTTGKITYRGRIGSLLEVGTGFHPELTGRENIYLNGAILGMRKREISRKFDEIVDFSGCARYIDTPVKRYSSGMTVRLGFAVAAFLEPEILVVDEVLAVGDAEFQKKAIGKMQDVSRNEGRTVLFVSHNMAAVRKLCNKGILLENGQLFASGEVSDILSLYQTRSIEKIKSKKIIENEELGNAEFRVLSINAISPEGGVLSIESGVKIQLEFENNIENKNIAISIFIVTLEDLILFEAPIIFSSDNNSQKGKYLIEWDIQPFLLNSGTYKINLLVGESQKYIVYKKDDILTFEIENALFDQGLNLNRLPGVMRPKVDFKISSL